MILRLRWHTQLLMLAPSRGAFRDILKGSLYRGTEALRERLTRLSEASQNLDVDPAQRRVTVDGAPVELTATEYAVLCELAVHAPRVLRRRGWGPARVGETWLVRNVGRRLQHKLSDDADSHGYIISEPRVGYRMGGSGGEERQAVH